MTDKPDTAPYDYYEPDDELSDEEAAAEDCGRWINGRLSRQCVKAGSEECDWFCPLHGVRE